MVGLELRAILTPTRIKIPSKMNNAKKTGSPIRKRRNSTVPTKKFIKEVKNPRHLDSIGGLFGGRSIGGYQFGALSIPWLLVITPLS